MCAPSPPRWTHVLLLLAVAGCGPRARPMTSLEDGIAQSEALLAVLPPDKPGCSAAVSESGVVVWAGARGLANVASHQPLDTRTIFDIASTSKQFTALAVLLLVKEHALTLDDAVSAHVPGLPAWASDVTLEQLMHHRSGIPDYTDLLTKRGIALTAPATQQDAMTAIAGATLTFTPGSKFAYSNSNYLLLAEVVSAVTSKPLPAFLDERVFRPLELDMRMDPAFTAPAVAVPYVMQGLALAESRSRWLQVGDGSIFTTPTQLARFGDTYRTGAVGGLDLISAALKAAVPTDTPGDSYGPGIDLATDGSLSHSGAWSGFATVFVVSADRTRVLAMSCNSFEMKRRPRWARA
jgi:CubicO group peptidase (beta-lactamase class C family)